MISEFTVFELVWIILFCYGIHIQYIYIYSYTVLSVFINSLNVSANSSVNLNCELDYGYAMRVDADDEAEDQFEISLEYLSDRVQSVEPPQMTSHALAGEERKCGVANVDGRRAYAR